MADSTEEGQFRDKTPGFCEAESHHAGDRELKPVAPPPKLVDDPGPKP